MEIFTNLAPTMVYGSNTSPRWAWSNYLYRVGIVRGLRMGGTGRLACHTCLRRRNLISEAETRLLADNMLQKIDESRHNRCSCSEAAVRTESDSPVRVRRLSLQCVAVRRALVQQSELHDPATNSKTPQRRPPCTPVSSMMPQGMSVRVPVQEA